MLTVFYPTISMMTESLIVVQGLCLLFLIALKILPVRVSENIIFRSVAITAILSVALILWLAIQLYFLPSHRLEIAEGILFDTGNTHFKILWSVDILSVVYGLFTLLLVSSIAFFSRRYLHKEIGYHRFYILLTMFMLGVTLAAFSGSLDVFIIGWELVGISSVLLISFFNYRITPVKNALWVFCVYRLGDLGLFGAVLLMHVINLDTGFNNLNHAGWGALAVGQAPFAIGLLFFIACMAKSALFPLSGWLPRAMEGPTPSSAIFYGAVSVHLGPLLLLRTTNILDASPVLCGVIAVIGALTTLCGMFVGYRQTDIKTVLAYGSVSQLGIIMIEIACGFYWIALLHCVGHGLFRTMQMLQAPNLLAERAKIEEWIGRHIYMPDPTRTPSKKEWIFYRLGLERFFLDDYLVRLVRILLKPFYWINRLIPDYNLVAFYDDKPIKKDFWELLCIGLCGIIGIGFLSFSIHHHVNGEIDQFAWNFFISCGFVIAFCFSIILNPRQYATSYRLIINICLLITGLFIIQTNPKTLSSFGIILICLLAVLPLFLLWIRLFEQRNYSIAVMLASFLSLLLYQPHGRIIDSELIEAGLVVGGCFMSVMALIQMHQRRALAFLTISQLSLLAFALNGTNDTTILGGKFLLITFLCANSGFVMLVAALETRNINLNLITPSGQYDDYPRLAICMMILGLICCGLPLSIGYVAEEMILGSSIAHEPLKAIVWLCAITLNAIIVLKIFLFLCNGISPSGQKTDIRTIEFRYIFFVLCFLSLLIIWSAFNTSHI